jgi:ABC-type Fe3+/spermidine/putrescine transport system ATPase subunit
VGGHIVVHGLQGAVPLPEDSLPDRADARVSIRPQALYLGAAVDGALSIGEVDVVSRNYLGEYWDYLVRPVAGGETLKVHAPPAKVLEIGHRAALSIDPRGVAVVS